MKMEEESIKRQMKMEEESKLRDEESRKRQNYADEAATELKDVIRSTDKMLQVVYEQIVKQQQEEQSYPHPNYAGPAMVIQSAETPAGNQTLSQFSFSGTYKASPPDMDVVMDEEED
jgi:hypothetical protein